MKNLHEKLTDSSEFYATWHKHAYHQFAQWLVLLLVIFFSFNLLLDSSEEIDLTAHVLSSKENTTAQVKSADFKQLPELNRQILNLSKSLKNAKKEDSGKILEELTLLAQNRKDLINQAIAENPRIAINSTINPQSRAQMPQSVRDLVEEKRSISGNFEYIHIHRGEFDSGTIEDQFYITETSSKKRFRVYFPEDTVNILTDDTVKIDGVVLGDNVVANFTDVEVLATTTPPVNSKKAVAFLINFSTKNHTINKETVRTRIYDTADSYFIENSFNAWGITGKNSEDGNADVLGPYTIAYDGVGCYTTLIRNQAKDAAIAAGINLSGYTNFLYFFPGTDCGYSGLATVGGNPGEVYMNGGASQGTIIHELGHNMGAYHSGTWSCTEGGTRVSISSDSNCVLYQYGDPFDVMGASSSMAHMNNYHKGLTSNSLNWLQSTNKKTIDRNIEPDALHTIAPIEQASDEIQSLRIPRNISGNTVLDYYHIEFRQPFGFDQSISSNATNGVTIRIGPNYNSATHSKMVDTTPNTTSFVDAPLAVGKTFVDADKSINVSTISTSPTGAVVRVSFGSAPCVNSSPSISITPSSQVGSPGDTLSYSVTVINNDASTCASSSYSVTPTLPSGFLQSPTSFTTSPIAPGQNQTTVVNLTSPGSATSGNFSFSETAQNTLNSSFSATTSATYTVIAPDSTPPTVDVTKPKNNSAVPSKGNLNISASASDDQGISKIEIFFDSEIIKTCTSTKCSTNYRVNSISTGVHTITAKATDTSGNTATDSVTVIQ